MPYLEEGQLEDYEYPDEPDEQGELEDCYVNCPECGALVYDDAPQCPECDWYLSTLPRTSPFTKSVIVALLAFFILYAVFY